MTEEISKEEKEALLKQLDQLMEYVKTEPKIPAELALELHLMTLEALIEQYPTSEIDIEKDYTVSGLDLVCMISMLGALYNLLKEKETIQ